MPRARRVADAPGRGGEALSSDGVIMGVDVGSGSTKGVLVTSDGRLLAEAERPMTIARPRPGWAEQDADGDWWSAFVAPWWPGSRQNVRRMSGVVLMEAERKSTRVTELKARTGPSGRTW